MYAIYKNVPITRQNQPCDRHTKTSYFIIILYCEFSINPVNIRWGMIAFFDRIPSGKIRVKR